MNADEKAAKNKALAEALGWRAELSAESKTLFDPMGGVVANYELRHALHTVLFTEMDVWAWIPDFYGSVDATLATLPEEADVFIETWDRVKKPNYAAWVAEVHRGDGDTRAEALANAALAWAQVQVAAQHGGVEEGRRGE